MRFSFLLALILTLSLAGVQWYQSTRYICPVPINYRLGVIDESFSITEAEAKDYIEQASEVWEGISDRDLFVYNDEADFTINFVFDERQETANQQTADRERLDNIAIQNDEFRLQIDRLQTSFENQNTEFKVLKANYDERLVAYNNAVRQANDRGGATPAAFEVLEEERAVLEAESNQLRTSSGELNQLAQQLNQLSTEGNRLVDLYNLEVQKYNNLYGEAHEFTQGDYRGGEINIYKFSDEIELINVLAHEFGHALGIDHVEEPGALMYYLLNDELDQKPVLTEIDIAAFQTECSNQGVGADIRGFIRETLTRF